MACGLKQYSGSNISHKQNEINLQAGHASPERTGHYHQFLVTVGLACITHMHAKTMVCILSSPPLFTFCFVCLCENV